MSSENTLLPLATIQSFVQPSFWNKLSDLKINVDKLDEAEREIWGYFSDASSIWNAHIVEVDSTSFNKNFESRPHTVPFHGRICNKNTIEGFKNVDKNALIHAEGRRFMDRLKNGDILKDPSLLNFFLILAFSDLKKFHFYYWFAFPVPHDLPILLEELIGISAVYSEDEMLQLNKQYQQLNSHQKPYFLIHQAQIFTFESTLNSITSDNFGHFVFAFFDYNTPKIQLKNYVVFLLNHCPFLHGRTLNFLLLSIEKNQSWKSCKIYKVTLPESIENSVKTWAGWEKNEKRKFAPRFSNMKSTMDPKTIFEESVDLNLKLMKWRLLPDLNLDKIKNTNCLLLGAGTLGCSVARTLLGWGVRNITFVDNSTVSFSNPVRQSLFTYQDSLESKSKAQAAADNLKTVFPGINSKGYDLTIPMPGHSVSESTVKGVLENYEQLKTLIQNNDIIFLLTDSRESRWLPTLLGIFFQKTVINVALGFDSYLVMRYGCRAELPAEQVQSHFIAGSELGCYFCNDVTAPGDSMKDRTLDQQCTVTRPGVSAIAGALAVELAVSLTQHEKGASAPAFCQTNSDSEPDEEQSLLGILPHSIRGFLSSYTHILPATPKYKQCIACSATILAEYEKDTFEFLLKAFNSSKYLEDLTGLTQLLSENNFEDVLELDDGEEWNTV